MSRLNPNDDVCMKIAAMLHLIPYDIVFAVALDAILMEDVLLQEVLDVLEKVS